MKKSLRLTTAGCVIAGTAAGLLLVSCSSIQRTVIAPPPAIEGASFVGNKVCYDCHTNYVRIFASSPHAHVHVEGGRMAGQSGCESCHGPGSKHAAVGGGRGRFVVNPGKDPAACYSCHLQVQAEFSLPQHHPVPEGHMNCVQCHDPHGADIMSPARLLSIARGNATCAQCHRDQTRPVIYEHEALREGCMVCHNPHGSINAKMLVERDYNLCLKCHAQVPGQSGEIYFGDKPHRARLAQGACWSAGCHSAIHGSNINTYMLY
jgi:predicted CXXCH cytochrome family protein